MLGGGALPLLQGIKFMMFVPSLTTCAKADCMFPKAKTFKEVFLEKIRSLKYITWSNGKLKTIGASIL